MLMKNTLMWIENQGGNCRWEQPRFSNPQCLLLIEMLYELGK
jgi:hypothetical protein